jgi:2-succinyl-6-hydroxy-2,4-cyclohexadiene-1-carboxylate synthase
MVLAAPSLAGAPQDPGMEKTYIRLFQLYHVLGPGPHLRDFWMDCHAWNGVEKRDHLRESLAVLVTQHRWKELEGFAIRKFMEPPQQESQLRHIPIPTLVLVGDKEMQAFRNCAALLARTLPECVSHELFDTGHLCLLQSPEAAAGPIEAHFRAHAERTPAVPEHPPGEKRP